MKSYSPHKRVIDCSSKALSLLRTLGKVLAFMWLGIFAAPAFPLDKTLHHFDIPEQDLIKSIHTLSNQTQTLILFPYELVENRKGNAVTGQYTVLEALNKVLQELGLIGLPSKTGALTISREKGLVLYSSRGDERMNTKKKLLASVVSFFVGSSGSGAFAQEVADAKEGSGWMLEEIIVTAQKREQNLIDVPISIVAIGPKEIESRGISNFEDLGLAVPGLSVQDNGGANRRIFMRGLGNSSGFGSSLVGLYLDDMSVSGNPVFTLDLRPYDMERIEVLRGPQGTLYGDGSVGGTIRFITQKPQLDSFSGKVDIAASFTEGGDPGQKIQAAVNVPLIKDELGLRIAGTYENAGGWIDQPAQSAQNYNGEEVTNLRVNALWHVSELLDLSAMGVVHRNNASMHIGEDKNGNHIQVFDLTETPSFDDDYEIYNFTLRYDFGVFELMSSTGYLDSSAEANGFGFRNSGFDILQDGPVNTTIFSEEVRISSTSEGPLNWTLGMFYKDRQVDQEADIYFGAPGPLPAAPFLFVDYQNSKSWATFGDLSYALTERLEIGAGLRYFEDDRDLFDGTTTQADTFDSTSPRVYANFELTDDINIYTSASKGFRSGGFNNFGQPSFDPETIWSYELGTKMSLLDGRFNAELAAFYSEYTDFQVSGVVPGSGNLAGYTSNGGGAEITGLDVGLSFQATDSLMLGFNGNYVDTEVVDLSVTSATHIVGDSLDYVSKYSVTLSATQNFEWGGKSGFARMDFNQQDRMYLTNRQLGILNSSGVISMLNFQLELTLNDGMSIGLFGKNLLDERDFIDPLNPSVASRPRPRTFGVQVGLDF